MGVVYKLTQDVVDFILSQKRAHPKLSCRQLTEILEAHFDLHISKSSINKVLKRRHLSSPVGRRADGVVVAKKKFTIPESRKQGLFPKSRPGRSPEGAPCSNPPERPSLESGVETRPVYPKPDGRNYPGMGAVFLKAAEWAISERPVLADFIRKYLKNDSLADIDTIAEVLLYSPVFGIKGIHDFKQYKSKGLWALHGLPDSLNQQAFYDVVNGLGDINRLALDLSLEIPSVLTKIQCIKIVLEDGESILMDPLLATAHNKNVQTGHFLPLQQCIKNVVECLIENVHSAVFCSIGKYNENGSETSPPFDMNGLSLSEEFVPFMQAFDQKAGKKIQKIMLFDQENREIMTFDDIPDMPRQWIGALWPWQEGFEKLSWEGKIHGFSSKLISKELFYRRLKMNGTSLPLMGGWVISEHKDSPPVLAVLTNNRAAKGEAILQEFINKWPHLDKGHFIQFIKKHQLSSTEDQKTVAFHYAHEDLFQNIEFYRSSDLFQMSYHFLSLLSEYCLSLFFDKTMSPLKLEECIADIYSLSGRIMEQDDSIRIFLDLNKHKFSKEIEKAIKMLNESHIKDFKNRLLFVTYSYN